MHYIFSWITGCNLLNFFFLWNFYYKMMYGIYSNIFWHSKIRLCNKIKINVFFNDSFSFPNLHTRKINQNMQYMKWLQYHWPNDPPTLTFLNNFYKVMLWSWQFLAFPKLLLQTFWHSFFFIKIFSLSTLIKLFNVVEFQKI